MVTFTSPVSLSESTRSPVLAVTTKPNLEDVLVRAQVGDPDAFSELYVKHKNRVFLTCLRMVRNFSLAEDLTQETFIQLHRKLASFRGDAAFTTWLHRMTINIVLMHLRKRTLSMISLDHMTINIEGEQSEIRLGTPDANQVGVVDRVALERALATLSVGYRNVFLLHDLHGFPHRDIASIDGSSIGNSKSQLHKARRAMRAALTSQTACVPDPCPNR
jgi:RNA polymerase sigma-70 factor (ECF subfamily)